MSTTTGPNLAPAKAAVEALMDDTCTITRDPSGNLDTSIDDVTGAIVYEVADSAVVFTGRCKVSSAGLMSGTHGSTEGGGSINPRIYTGSIPLDSPDIKIGDNLEVTSSRRDPDLVGRVFRVTDVRFGTFSVSRKFVLELRQ